MSVDAATVKRIGRLARIRIEEGEVAKYQDELNAILGFVAQLESPPPQAEDYMNKLLRKAAYGVGNWFRAEDMHRLKSAYGFAGEFKDFRKMAAAAMLRTAWKENACEGGLAHKAYASLV